MAGGLNLKRRIFNLGVEAANAIGIATDGYLCPLCGNGFGEECLTNGTLTIEHVPPKSDGGKPLILTCKTCNNSAGHNYEFDLKKRREIIGQTKCLVEQADGEFGHVKLKIGDLALNANLSRRNGTTHFEITDHNDPASLKSSLESFKSFAEGSELQVSSSKSYSKYNIEKADLKSAFLVMVAKFGYTIGFDQRMVPIRQAIICETDHTDLIHYIDLDSPANDKIFLDEKLGVAALKVEDRGVVIPWPSHPLSNFQKRGNFIKMQAKLFPLPRTFESLIDFHQANSSTKSD